MSIHPLPVLGVRWDDVDLVGARVAVRQTIVNGFEGKPVITTPKSDQARSIDLDPGTVKVLRGHRRRAKEQRLAFGAGHHNSGLVFTREDGSLMRPDSVGQRLACLCERAIKAGELATKIGLHGLRHTHATLALEANVSVKVVSERLGHASPAFTMAVYQHALPTLQAEAARSIANLVEHAGEGHEGQAQSTAD